MKLFYPVLIVTAFMAPAFQSQADTTPNRAQTMTLNGMTIIDNRIGNGAIAKNGNTVVVHYTGWLYDPTAPESKGQKFDSSVDRGEPFSFMLGAGRVIRGWDEGVAGMKVGSKRTLVIPPELGYGNRGAGRVIPPNATLIFDVELLDVH
ncbi:MAG: FKBP-type peptidyl-prolyl cis-trans isomerase [Betaproteobacteria bacterium]|nr:FKBP-type peptidyl-prolyl cis-trans isomerase [Betaproteobacteria bacterium]